MSLPGESQTNRAARPTTSSEAYRPLMETGRLIGISIRLGGINRKLISELVGLPQVDMSPGLVLLVAVRAGHLVGDHVVEPVPTPPDEPLLIDHLHGAA